jgi:hypothetical protein
MFATEDLLKRWFVVFERPAAPRYANETLSNFVTQLSSGSCACVGRRCCRNQCADFIDRESSDRMDAALSIWVWPKLWPMPGDFVQFSARTRNIIEFVSRLFAVSYSTVHFAAVLLSFTGGLGVAGSNPVAPTI